MVASVSGAGFAIAFLRLWLVLFTRVVAPIVCITSVGMIILGVRDVIRASDSREWPIVQGQVTLCDVIYHDDPPDDFAEEHGYEAMVEYRYRVANQDYVSSRRSFSWYKYVSPSNAHAIPRKYPKGGSVAVHYMPDDPSVAVLEPGFTWLVVCGPLIGLLGVVVSVLMFLFLPSFVKRKLGRM
jgi:hypothetical protein